MQHRHVFGPIGIVIISCVRCLFVWVVHCKHRSFDLQLVCDWCFLFDRRERLHELWLGDLRDFDGIVRLHDVWRGYVLHPDRCFVIVVVRELRVGQLLGEPRVLGVLGMRRRLVLCSGVQRLLELRVGHIRCEHGLRQLHGLCSRQLLDRDRGCGIVDLHELPVRDVCFEQRYDIMHIVRWRDLHSRRGSELHGLQRGLIPVAGRIVRLCGVRCRDILDIDERRNVIGVHGLRCRHVCLQHRGHVMLVMLGRQLLSRRGEQLHELCRRHLPIGHKCIELHGMSGEYILDRRWGLELDHVHSLPFGLSASYHWGH